MPQPGTQVRRFRNQSEKEEAILVKKRVWRGLNFESVEEMDLPGMTLAGPKKIHQSAIGGPQQQLQQ